jgi:hypothetical protein
MHLSAGNQRSGVLPANLGLMAALVKMDISRNILERYLYSEENSLGEVSRSQQY